MHGGFLDKHIEKIRELYKKKRDIMVEYIQKYFPKEVKWNIPKGGMFLWIQLPKKIDTRLMFQKSIAKKVAYVLGDAFYPEGKDYNAIRLNFSYSEDEMIKEGIRRLAEVIKEELRISYEDESFLPEGV